METVSSPTIRRSSNTNQTTEETATPYSYTPSLENIAVAITFRQTIDSFADDAPAKMKWSNLTASDVRRFMYYDIIEESENTMGTQTVWALQEWVEDFLTLFSDTFNFSTKQIKELTRYSDTLIELDDEFVGKETQLAGRSLGHLNGLDLIEMKEDNRHQHKPTVWTVSENVERLLTIRSYLV